MGEGDRTTGEMNWSRVKAVLGAALDLPHSERAAFLDRECAGIPGLRRRVERLLSAEERADTLLAPPGAGSLKALLTTDAAALVGATLARYTVIRHIGTGGMGAVYEAEQESPRRRVALKLPRSPLTSSELARRFEYEGLILGRLQHPGIAQIFEAGVADVRVSIGGTPTEVRQPFLAIEYIDGPNIIDYAAGRSGSGALGVRATLDLVASVCDAIHYAHQRGIIHRDLKPENILVANTSAGAQPKVLDFGVARMLEPDPDLSRAHTNPGQVIGTLAYMSPEQISGDSGRIDTRTDVYSLGVVLYRLLAGSLPFDLSGVSLPEAIRVVNEQEAPPLMVPEADLRADVQAIVSVALARDRDRRYQSAAEMAADLRRCNRGEPIAARRDSGWYTLRRMVRRHRTGIAVVVLFLVLLVSSSVAGWLLYGSAQRARRQVTALLRDSYVNQARAIRSAGGIGRRFEAMDALKKAAAITVSHELRSEAIACLAVPDLYVERELPATTAPTARGLRTIDRIAFGTAGAEIVVQRVPDGTTLATFSGLSVKPAWMMFSPDGAYLASIHNEAGKDGEVIVWSIAAAREVLRISRKDFRFGLAFGRTGEVPWLAAVEGPGNVRVMELPSGEERMKFTVHPQAMWLAADAAGERIAVTGLDGTPIEVFSVTDGQRLWTVPFAAAARAPDWSSDGRLLAVGGSDFNVHVLEAGTGALAMKLEGHRSPVSEVNFGDDGSLASSGWDNATRLWAPSTGRPMFSPITGAEVIGYDGSRLVAWTDRTVRVLGLATDSPMRRLMARGPLSSTASIAFSSDGKRMVTGGGAGVEVWNLESGDSFTLTEAAAKCAFIAPDGSVGAVLDRSLVLWTSLGAGFAPARTLWTGTRATWATLSPEGDRAVVSSDRVFTIDLASGEERDISPSHTGMERPQVSPDGRWVFIGTWRGEPARVVDTSTGRVVLRFDRTSVRGAFGRGHFAVALPGLVRLYRLGEWRSFRTIEWKGSDTRLAGAVAFSPDGAMFAATSPPHSITLWHTHSAEKILDIPNPELLGVAEMSFSPDGRRLGIATLEREVLVWDLNEARRALTSTGLGW